MRPPKPKCWGDVSPPSPYNRRPWFICLSILSERPAPLTNISAYIERHVATTAEGTTARRHVDADTDTIDTSALAMLAHRLHAVPRLHIRTHHHRLLHTYTPHHHAASPAAYTYHCQWSGGSTLGRGGGHRPLQILARPPNLAAPKLWL